MKKTKPQVGPKE